MFSSGDPLARLAGKKAALGRWSRATPEDRARQGRALAEGLMAKYRAQARGIAAEDGYEPTDEHVERSARLLWMSDLADRRLLAYQAAMGKSAVRRAG